MEEPVRFSCGVGVAFGTLHTPEGNANPLLARVGVVFLNAGIRPRSGPYRQYVRFARRLCAAGFFVLRFDLAGVGDSEGLQRIDPAGRYPLDHLGSTISAIDFIKSEKGVERVVVIGICGGALAALLTTAAHKDIDALVLASLPVEDLGGYSEESLSRHHLHTYAQKALQWRSWVNLLCLRSNFGIMRRALGQVGHLFDRRENVDESLWQTFVDFVENGRSVLFIFGGTDPLYQTFASDFGTRLDEQYKGRRELFEVFVVAEADHTYSRLQWQDIIIDKSIAWLHSRYEST